MSLIKQIKTEVKNMFPELVSIRRHIHQNPELSFHEVNTSAFIRNQLDKYGIKYTSGYCKYGIVAEIKGKDSKKITYLRGDMDALPILEMNDVPYKSVNEGIMHACGHDAHTTCVLGSAIILNRLRKKLPGTYRIIFQPAEEKLPGGASIMIKEGAIKNVNKSKIIAQHVHPPLEAGKVGFYAGEYMASADEIHLEVTGSGGHAALPNELVDPIIVSAHILTSLQTIVSRNSDPKVPTVLSFGKINSDGGATNVIPDRVVILGTMRTMDENNRLKLHKAIKDMVRNTARSFGAKTKIQIKYGYPTLINDEQFTRDSMDHARDFLGKNNVVQLEKRMTAEDFSYFTQMMPACFYRLGTGNAKKGITSSIHTPTFDIDEQALKTGVGLMTYLAIQSNS